MRIVSDINSSFFVFRKVLNRTLFARRANNVRLKCVIGAIQVRAISNVCLVLVLSFFSVYPKLCRLWYPCLTSIFIFFLHMFGYFIFLVTFVVYYLTNTLKYMVEIANLTFSYSKKKMLFENLNLSLKPGHIYGLLGKNGAGKSTLLKNITGLAFPKGGSCRIKGIDSSKRMPTVLEDLYFVPEEIYVPAVSIKQYVKDTALFYPKFDSWLFEKYLEEFEVPLNGVLTKLSFGQQKKALISFGLACCTSLLIMDEPTNGLDIPSKAQFRKIVASALGEEQCIIISTHQVRDLDNLIDAILVLHNGRIILNKNLDEISERVSFRVLREEEAAGALYYENTVKGLEGIVQNKNGWSSRVDMELLFNSVTAGNHDVLTLINKSDEQFI